MTITLQMKRTKTGKAVVYGPLSVMKPGMRVKVELQGKPTEVTVRSLGKPFTVDGQPMVYGYMTGDGHSHHIGESIASLGLGIGRRAE